MKLFAVLAIIALVAFTYAEDSKNGGKTPVTSPSTVAKATEQTGKAGSTKPSAEDVEGRIGFGRGYGGYGGGFNRGFGGGYGGYGGGYGGGYRGGYGGGYGGFNRGYGGIYG